MPKPAPEEELGAIEHVLEAHPGGLSRASIAEALSNNVSPRTLQSRLQYLINQGRVNAAGVGRATRYKLAQSGTTPEAFTEVPLFLGLRQKVCTECFLRREIRA